MMIIEFYFDVDVDVGAPVDVKGGSDGQDERILWVSQISIQSYR